MHLQDGNPPLDVGAVEHYLAVEAAWAQESGVQHVGAVGGCYHYDVRLAVEPVHLHQYLVQRLVPLVLGSCVACPTVASHGVNLINEDNAGGVTLGLLEQVADAAATHPHDN